jgi:hypothetical protein
MAVMKYDCICLLLQDYVIGHKLLNLTYTENYLLYKNELDTIFPSLYN